MMDLLLRVCVFFCFCLILNQAVNVDEQTDNTQLDEPRQPAQELFVEGSALVSRIDTASKRRGYIILKQASDEGNRNAQEILAYGYVLGVGLERNFTRAFELFSELAVEGHPAGQQGLGLMYSLGIGVRSSQAKAVLNFVFAALGGHHFAQMTMGYRSLMGIGVVQSCESALLYYYKAAEKVISEVSLITGGYVVSKIRLVDDDEPTNIYAVSEDDMIHYHHVFADSGNSGAQMLIGMFYMYGSGGVERNFQMALKFLKQAAREGVPAATTLIGKIYAEGSDDVPRDYVAAMENFEKAIDLKHGEGYSGMGMIYLNGMGVEQNYATAFKLFQQASDRGSAEGQYYLGYMHYNGYGVPRDQMKALRYYQLAAHGGHLLAIYSLGEMHAEGIGVKRNCNFAVDLFKTVSERGHWTRLFTEAEKLYETGNVDSALMLYFLAAELGVEVAQSNVAYILEQDDVSLIDKNETLKRALIYWNRAASQGYAEARVKLGDYYYYGQGTTVNYEVAAHQYRMASDKQTCAQAMFNLGYMYQEGLGLEKDYHLAKRYYDMASETSSEAIVPVKLALLKMNVLYLQDSYEHIFDSLSSIQSLLGPDWDAYIISVLIGLIVLLFIWRRNNA